MKLSEILAGNPDLAALASEKSPPADPPPPQVNPPESAAADVTATAEQLEEEGLVKPKRRGRKSNAEKAAEAAAKAAKELEAKAEPTPEAVAQVGDRTYVQHANGSVSVAPKAKAEPTEVLLKAGFEGEIVGAERTVNGYRITIEGAGQAVIGRKVRIL